MYAYQNHLRFRRLKNQVTKLFNFQTSLEWKLKLATLDDDIWEIKPVVIELLFID